MDPALVVIVLIGFVLALCAGILLWLLTSD